MSKLFERMGALLLLGFPACALASNGMYLIGYGTESVLMGGADVAVSRDAFAANNNPSGMTQISGQSTDLEMVVFDKQEFSHTDSFGNYRKPDAYGVSGYTNAAYARHFENSPYAAGATLVIQGGLGWTFRGLNTQFGTRDDASSLFTVIKLAPALAWQVNDQLSLGVALGINYLGGTQELLPNTAVNPSPAWPQLPQGFNGFRFKGASGIGLNSKWGLQYRPAQDVVIGVTYGTPTAISMKNGELRMNFSNLGLGVVRYDNAKLEGFHLPEELTLGIAFRPTSPLLVSVQDRWYQWADALNTLTITATEPRGAIPAPLQKVVIPGSAGFVNQHVISIGLAYDYNKDTVLMAGMNHGPRPIRDNNVNPIFRPIAARHYMLGAKRQLDDGWNVAGGLEFETPSSVTYDSPIFGSRANERDYAIMCHVSVGRRW